jgi:hypothetical protein
MKAIFAASILAILGGCNGTPLPEYNYRGAVPEPGPVNVAMVTDFSANLAREAGLHVVDQSKLTGNERADETFSVHLRAAADEKINVTVMAHFPSRTLFVTVAGNIESPMAKEIAQRAEALYKKKYPGSKLAAFTRYRGLLGP